MSMHTRRTFFIALASFGVLLIPALALAATGDFTGSIVQGSVQTCPGNWSSFLGIISRIIQFAIYLGIMIAVLVAAYGGFLLVMNPTMPENKAKAKSAFLNAAIGLVITLAAWLIVNTLLTVLGVSGGISGVTSKLGTYDTSGSGCITEKTTPSVFSGTDSLGVTTDAGSSSGGAIAQAVCSAANAYRGTSTANAPGTNGGRSACAYAVSQVVQKAGYGSFSSNVATLEGQLTGGRGTAESQSAAVCGDIVVQAGDHHVGICLNAGCTSVISNSSSNASFSWTSGPDFSPSYTDGVGRFYRLTN